MVKDEGKVMEDKRKISDDDIRRELKKIRESTTQTQSGTRGDDDDKYSASDINLVGKIRDSLWKNLSDEQKDQYERLGQKFHQSFNVDTQHTQPHDIREIALEECLAYVVESLKSGLHPRFTTREERGLLVGTYGSQWYERFMYETSELKDEYDMNGDPLIDNIVV